MPSPVGPLVWAGVARGSELPVLPCSRPHGLEQVHADDMVALPKPTTRPKGGSYAPERVGRKA